MRAAIERLPTVEVPSNVPLKHRSNCPSPTQFYKYLHRIEDFSVIKFAMLAEGVCRSESRADELIDAFLQWFAVGATSVTTSYVMIAGPVDRTFHQMLLNTKWYFRFCYEHTGVYTHHDPLTETQRIDPQLMKSVGETLDRLNRAYGQELHPELKRWIRLYQGGKLSATSVSCVGNSGPFDIVPT